jgi:hypothetical protein
VNNHDKKWYLGYCCLKEETYFLSAVFHDNTSFIAPNMGIFYICQPGVTQAMLSIHGNSKGRPRLSAVSKYANGN